MHSSVANEGKVVLADKGGNSKAGFLETSKLQPAPNKTKFPSDTTGGGVI